MVILLIQDDVKYYYPMAKKLAIKPQNIFDKQTDACIQHRPIPLIDIPDRLGEVCICEVVMGTREDVAKFLCEKHNASIDVELRGGTTVRKMVNRGSTMASPVHIIIRKHGERSVIRCANCQKIAKEGEDFQICSRCKNASNASYCSITCQKENWAEHKPLCKKAKRNEIRLNRPTVQLPPHMKNSMVNIAGIPATGEYRRPTGVAVDEFFRMKVQADVESKSLLLYDRTRTCTFALRPEDVGFAELLEKVRAERGAMGQKCHVEALFDKKGDCRVYPSTATLYKW